MRIDVILEANNPPETVLKLGRLAEEQGLGGVWVSNMNDARDPFINFVPLAMQTERIHCGAGAVARSALQAERDLLAVLVHVFRYVGRADAALLIAGHSEIHELRVRQIELRHDPDEFLQRFSATDARIAGLFLADAGYAPSLVIVARIDQHLVRQGEELAGDRAVQRCGIAVLEVGTTTAVDQQGIAGEYAIMQPVSEMVVGMAGRVQRQDRDTANGERPGLIYSNIDTRQAVRRRTGDTAAGFLPEAAGRGQMVCMDMRIEGTGKPELQTVELGKIALPGWQHRIDQHCKTGFFAAEQIGPGT